jgi:hypothetical protein
MADSNKNGAAPMSCEVCSAKVNELRRGRCWGCYTKWSEGRPVGLGAACVTCENRRRADLRMTELLGAWVPMCHNCSAHATRLSPMPQTLAELRTRHARERRPRDRRGVQADTRARPRERRGLERRHAGAALGDDLVLLGDDDILIIDGSTDEPVEETRIQPPPSPAR